MKKISKESEMCPEYDFSKGVRGKHYRAYQEDSNVIFLEPEIKNSAASEPSFKTNRAVSTYPPSSHILQADFEHKL